MMSDFLPKDLGSAEIWVIANDGKIFACPDLILHYIVDHNYLPPEEFIEAVENGPIPNSTAFKKMLT